jgi:hypothetical protein
MSTNGHLKFQGTNRATFVGATSNIMFDTTSTSLGIGVTGTDHPSSNLYITGNAYVTSDIGVGGVLTMGTVNVVARHDLESVTATGNTTPLTVEFQNADTSLVASGNVEVGKELTVTGNTTVSSNLTVSGDVEVAKELTVTGNATVSSNLTVSGNVEVGTANLFVDTASSRVGIGTTTPQEKLHVYGAPMIQHDTTYQYIDPTSPPNNPTAWYKLGVWEGSDSTGQGANLKLTLLGGSGYHGPDNNKSGETVIHAKLLNNQEASVANIGGMFYSVGNPTVHQVKFKQVDTNRNKYEVHAEFVQYTQHNMSIECSMTTSFTRSFTASPGGDPGADSATVRAAKFTHIINESGYLGIDTKTPSGTLEVSSTRTGFTDLGVTTNEATLMISCTDPNAADSGDIGGGVVFRQRWFNNSTDLIPTGGIYGYKDRNSGSYGGCPDNGTGNALSEAMRITKEGNVGIGTQEPHAPLTVFGIGGSMYEGTARSYFWAGLAHTNTGSGWSTNLSDDDLGIYSEKTIATSSSFLASNGTFGASDERIKKEIVDINDASALETLRLLKPKQYKYVDEIKSGSEPVWGFIAQEVRETLPYATQLRRECIPNIYELANVSDSRVITFINFDTSDLESNVMVLKVFDKDNTGHLVNITEVVDEHTIHVEEDLSEWTDTIEESEGEKIFVYGQRVDDFVYLKKESIWTVATAALQEVDSQLQAEKARNDALEARIAALENNISS